MKCFRIESGERQGCIICSWVYNVYMDAVKKEGKVGMGRMGMRFMEEGREWRLPVILYVDDLISCVESE